MKFEFFVENFDRHEKKGEHFNQNYERYINITNNKEFRLFENKSYDIYFQSRCLRID